MLLHTVMIFHLYLVSKTLIGEESGRKFRWSTRLGKFWEARKTEKLSPARHWKQDENASKMRMVPSHMAKHK